RAVPKNDGEPEVAAASRAPNVRGFLVWSRFPYWELRRGPEGMHVTMHDMRFGAQFAASTIVTDTAVTFSSARPLMDDGGIAIHETDRSRVSSVCPRDGLRDRPGTRGAGGTAGP